MTAFFAPTNVQQRSFPTAATHNFYIYGVIEELPDYVDLITVLDYAQEHDTINVFINSPGGDLDVAISIIHAIMRTRANVSTYADGRVASAATLIFLASQSQVVLPYSNFMFHDGAYGMSQKVNEHLKHATATTELLSKLAHDLYSSVFSEDEIEEILEGRDRYMDSEEMVERLSAHYEKMEEEIEKAQKELEEEEQKPKRTRKRKKKSE